MSTPSAQLPQLLWKWFEERARQERAMVLVTVLSTSGSTYSKLGDQMLVGGDGRFRGMLSGGCLEGDLAERARRVIASGAAEFVEYDLRDDDGVFGLGVGCEGVIRVLLQPLLPATGYEPFAQYLRDLESRPIIDVELRYENAALQAQEVRFRLRRPQRVLVLGAGGDAGPLLQIFASLGWQLGVYDHRSSYLESLAVPDSCDATCAPADALAAELDLSRYDAAIVMSHHLASDREYLAALAASAIPFVGLLGPPHRRDRLLAELGERADGLQERLRSPVGRKIGGRGPGPIALEIAAELQAYFCRED